MPISSAALAFVAVHCHPRGPSLEGESYLVKVVVWYGGSGPEEKYAAVIVMPKNESYSDKEKNQNTLTMPKIFILKAIILKC